MSRGVLEEMEELLNEERPDMLVTETRRLARDYDLELPVGANVEQALALAEAFVDSPDFEQLDEGVREAWRWVLRKMKGVVKTSIKATVGAFVVPAVLGPAAFVKGTAWGAKKVLKKLRSYEGGSGELLRGDEPFTLGNVAFHPQSQNRWRAVLPGRFELIVRYRPNQGTFQCALEGRPVGGHWNEDDLGYAVQMAVAMTVEPEPPEEDPRLGRL